MPRYFLRVAQTHPSFRLPSFQCISDLFEFPIKFISEDLMRAILVIELEKDEHLERLLDRGTLIMWAGRLLADGSSYDELHSSLRDNHEAMKPYLDKSFKFEVESGNHSIPKSRQTDVINSFVHVGFSGKIDLKNPELQFLVFEDYDLYAVHTTTARLDHDGKFNRVYFGLRMGNSRARPLIHSHSIKSRTFYGNTSMESEMSFLMAGQALPAPGKVMYDPFVGTGSMLYALAHWGAYVFGSDIDGRQTRGKMKGKESIPGILRAAAQYGVQDHVLDILTFDVTRGPLRRGGWIDAIVTDPPYGVRAGAKRLGKRTNAKTPAREEPFILPDGTPSHLQPGYRPPSRPYELANLTLDLVHLARYLLVPKGRLVFFLPTVTEDFDHVDVPVVEGMREIKIGDGSVQDFGKWGRRLITMEKTALDDGPPPTFDDHDEEFDAANGKVPGHYDFNHRYFGGFMPRTNGSSEQDDPATIEEKPINS